MISLLWFIIIFLLVIPIISENTDSLDGMSIFGIVILSLITVMLFWILIYTRYKINYNILSYSSGQIRGKIQISKIKKVEHWQR